MKCYCCDHILTTQESTRKFKESGNYTEMCTTCLNTISDIETEEGMDEELFDDDDGNSIEE